MMLYSCETIVWRERLRWGEGPDLLENLMVKTTSCQTCRAPNPSHDSNTFTRSGWFQVVKMDVYSFLLNTPHSPKVQNQKVAFWQQTSWLTEQQSVLTATKSGSAQRSLSALFSCGAISHLKRKPGSATCAKWWALSGAFPACISSYIFSLGYWDKLDMIWYDMISDIWYQISVISDVFDASGLVPARMVDIRSINHIRKASDSYSVRTWLKYVSKHCPCCPYSPSWFPQTHQKAENVWPCAACPSKTFTASAKAQQSQFGVQTNSLRPHILRYIKCLSLSQYLTPYIELNTI